MKFKKIKLLSISIFCLMSLFLCACQSKTETSNHDTDLPQESKEKEDSNSELTDKIISQIQESATPTENELAPGPATGTEKTTMALNAIPELVQLTSSTSKYHITQDTDLSTSRVSKDVIWGNQILVKDGSSNVCSIVFVDFRKCPTIEDLNSPVLTEELNSKFTQEYKQTETCIYYYTLKENTDVQKFVLCKYYVGNLCLTSIITLSNDYQNMDTLNYLFDTLTWTFKR